MLITNEHIAHQESCGDCKCETWAQCPVQGEQDPCGVPLLACLFLAGRVLLCSLECTVWRVGVKTHVFSIFASPYPFLSHPHTHISHTAASNPLINICSSKRLHVIILVLSLYLSVCEINRQRIKATHTTCVREWKRIDTANSNTLPLFLNGQLFWRGTTNPLNL